MQHLSQNTMLKIAMETSKGHFYFSVPCTQQQVAWNLYAWKAMLTCCNRLSPARQHPPLFSLFLPFLQKMWNERHLISHRNLWSHKQELTVGLDIKRDNGAFKNREEGEWVMLVRGSLWRNRAGDIGLLFVCALAPVCFSFSPMNKEGLYGVNGTLFLYNYSFLSLIEP